jgi:hypothetical protein
MGYVAPGPTPQPGVGEALEGVLLTAAMRTIAPASAHDGFAAVAEDGLRSFLQDAYPEYLNVVVTTDGQPYSAEAFRRKGSPFPETASVHLREPGGCALVGLMLALAMLRLAVSVLAL